MRVYSDAGPLGEIPNVAKVGEVLRHKDDVDLNSLTFYEIYELGADKKTAMAKLVPSFPPAPMPKHHWDIKKGVQMPPVS